MRNGFRASMGWLKNCNFWVTSNHPRGPLGCCWVIIWWQWTFAGEEGFRAWSIFAVENFAVGNFAEAHAFHVVNFADTPRNVVVPGALQAQWSLATGATHNAGRPISHTPPVMRVKLVSGPDICSSFDSGIRLTPQARATVAPGKGAPGPCSFLFMGIHCL